MCARVCVCVCVVVVVVVVVVDRKHLHTINTVLLPSCTLLQFAETMSKLCSLGGRLAECALFVSNLFFQFKVILLMIAHGSESLFYCVHSF